MENILVGSTKPLMIFKQRCNMMKNKFKPLRVPLIYILSFPFILGFACHQPIYPPTPRLPNSLSYPFICSLAGPGIHTWAASPLSQRTWGPWFPVFLLPCLGLGSQPVSRVWLGSSQAVPGRACIVPGGALGSRLSPEP